MLSWANQFNIFCYLDSHNYEGDAYECLLGVNAKTNFDGTEPFELIDAYLQKGSWYFGHLSYELSNEVFACDANHEKIGFPRCFFFSPESVIAIKNHNLIIYSDDPDVIYNNLIQSKEFGYTETEPTTLRHRVEKDAYLQAIQKLREHILRGDCYEINFCQEFFKENAAINPLQTFQKLVSVSPTPFSAFYRLDEKYLICASPERFLKRMEVN
jgi:para-aminobenzoate synthetase component 1